MSYEYDYMKHSINVCFLVEKDGYLITAREANITDGGIQWYVPIIEFGNVIPRVGDIVVNPFTKNEMLEVKSVYFQPEEEPSERDTSKIGGGTEKVHHVGVYLVVEQRPLDDKKEHFFTS